MSAVSPTAQDRRMLYDYVADCGERAPWNVETVAYYTVVTVCGTLSQRAYDLPPILYSINHLEGRLCVASEFEHLNKGQAFTLVRLTQLPT